MYFEIIQHLVIRCSILLVKDVDLNFEMLQEKGELFNFFKWKIPSN